MLQCTGNSMCDSERNLYERSRVCVTISATLPRASLQQRACVRMNVLTRVSEFIDARVSEFIDARVSEFIGPMRSVDNPEDLQMIAISGLIQRASVQICV